MLAPGLRVVFCGTAAGEVAARVGAPYAGPGNRFWWVLHEVGLTPRELEPLEFRELPRWGIGLTDVAKHAVGGDSMLVAADFDARGGDREGGAVPAAASSRSWASVRRARCSDENRVGTASRRTFDRVQRVWVLPSTSGAARGFWDIEPWRGSRANFVS